MEPGFLLMSNSVRPIETFEDISGLKIRWQPNEPHLTNFRALDVKPLAMDVNELFSAVEQKVVDGPENPFLIIQVAGYPKVPEQVSNTGHFFNCTSVAANKDWFDGQSAEKQGWVHRGNEHSNRRTTCTGGRTGRCGPKQDDRNEQDIHQSVTGTCYRFVRNRTRCRHQNQSTF